MASSTEKNSGLGGWGHGLAARLASDILSNEKGTAQGKDIEALHRMRSRTNRLGCFVRLLGKEFGLRARRRWAADLRWLAAALGPVRDIDVMRERIESLLGKKRRKAAKEGIDFALRQLARRRKEERAALLKALSSQRWKDMKAGLARLAKQDPGLWGDGRGAAAAKPVEPPPPKRLFALVIAQRLASFSKRRQAALERMSSRRLHRLRLAGKQVRYALEFFSLFLGKEGERLIASFTRLQDCLGEAHDLNALDANLKSLRLGLLLSKEPKAQSRLAGISRLIQAGDKRCRVLYREFEAIWPTLHSPRGVVNRIERLAAQRPAAQRPAAQRPAAQRPAAQRPAAQRPAAPRPAAKA